MKVCAVIEQSAGNERVGDMWIEVGTFAESATLGEVLSWAANRKYYSELWERYPQLNVKIAPLAKEPHE